MRHFDVLSQPSKYHSVKAVTGGIQISVAEDTDECFIGCQRVIEEAETHAHEGYDVTMKHETSRRSGPLCDKAIILLRKSDDHRPPIATSRTINAVCRNPAYGVAFSAFGICSAR